MTKPSKMLGTIVAEKYVRKLQDVDGTYYFMVEADLTRHYGDEDNPAVLCRLIGYKDENVGVWARIHGMPDGSLWLGRGDETTPAEIRGEVDMLWGVGTAIVMTCCFPANVYKRYRKELAKYKIHLLHKEYTGRLYSELGDRTLVMQRTEEAQAARDRLLRM